MKYFVTIKKYKIPNICVELQKTLKNQNSFEEEHWWRHSWFQCILQSCSNQNSVILAWKQT